MPREEPILLTVATAVDLLQDLCAPGVESDLATDDPPIRLLVVDNDPMSQNRTNGKCKGCGRIVNKTRDGYGHPEKSDPNPLGTNPLPILEVWAHTTAKVTGGKVCALPMGDSGQ